MSRLKALVVDDEVVYRAMLTTALKEDPAFAPARMASEGAMALAAIDTEMPDVVTLDLDMPVMNGMTTLLEIRRRHPHLAVVVLSAFARPGMEELDVLAMGADDCVTKIPAGAMRSSLAWMREHILPRLKRAVELRRPQPSVAGPSPPPPRRVRQRAGDVAIVAIAASAGGPDSVEKVLAALPADLPVPIVVVQHMPPEFTRLFAERLSRSTPFRVCEGAAGIELVPGGVWIAPGGYHMVVARDAHRVVLTINEEPREHGCRPAADPLFRSIADVYGPRALAVVISGMGVDGLIGSRRLYQAGAQIVVQDEATSVVWGMPGAVAKAGLADVIAPLPKIPEEIVARTTKGCRRPTEATSSPAMA
jgi:two-component system, chemotaxis family, protein-glutamate methylesterase/glutaminase